MNIAALCLMPYALCLMPYALCLMLEVEVFNRNPAMTPHALQNGKPGEKMLLPGLKMPSGTLHHFVSIPLTSTINRTVILHTSIDTQSDMFRTP